MEPVWFAANGARMPLYRWQHPDPAAPRLLLVHGIGMGHRTFDRFVEAVAPYAEVVSVDLPGFGDAPEPDTALPMEGTAAFVAEALHSLGSSPAFGAERGEDAAAPARNTRPFIALGHSMGAQIVTELAVTHPELVERLVLIAPAVNADECALPKQMWRMVQDLFEGKPLIAIVRGVIDYCKTGPRWFAKKLGPMLDYPIAERATLVRQPALVICGSEDRVTPATWGLKVAHALPDGAFAVIDGPGHEAMIAEGARAAELVLGWAGISS